MDSAMALNGGAFMFENSASGTIYKSSLQYTSAYSEGGLMYVA